MDRLGQTSNDWVVQCSWEAFAIGVKKHSVLNNLLVANAVLSRLASISRASYARTLAIYVAIALTLWLS